MKLTNLNLSSNKLIVSISESGRDEVFQKEIVTKGGKQLFFIKEMEAPFTNDKFYSQTVNMGVVEHVSPDVTNFKVGDVIIMENIADADPGNIIETFEGGKRIVLTANTEYYDHGRYDPPEGNSMTGKWYYKKGDIIWDKRSFVICIVRNGEFISVGKNIISRHENYNPDSIGTKIKIKQDSKTPPRKLLAVRYVLIAPSDSPYQAKDVVVVPDTFVATFDMSGKLFNWFQTDDVLLHRMAVK